jgi:ASC-1-like (ASCH) protein
MPLFRVYRDIFDCIADGSKTIEVRTRHLEGDTAVFQCGRSILRKKIKGRQEFNLGDGFLEKNWKQVMPGAASKQSAIDRLMNIFPNQTRFYAYFFE